MFDFWKDRRSTGRTASSPHRRSRGPITIGFEQLEGRELLSVGVSVTIIPTDPRPLLSMPRPYVGSFRPEAEAPVVVSVKLRREPEDQKKRPGHRPWPLGGRFRGW